MVQRKVPNKLGIQADHVKSEKRLGNLKQSSFQHQDGKNRGPDMKKRMKRSRSIKLSDIESLKSSPPPPLTKAVSQPGKPPPLNAQNTTTTPQKQLMVKTSDSSPNYMKSTSSSEARKERSQVSPMNTQTGSNSNNMHRRDSSNSKFSSASSNKATRTLTKTSSLKLVRTPSFKPVRGTAKKGSRVVLCADMNAQKATCSSTLKDSKFPAYLMLNPGGTEAEGTSATKICPYTYCSLNGHHHKPVPPLKRFLKARRRSLKVQKSMKLKVLSPRRARSSGDGIGEIHGGLLDFSDDKPMIQEDAMDFFIEIYAKNTEDGSEATERSTENEVRTDDAFSGKPEGQINVSFYMSVEAAAEQDNDMQVSNGWSDESPESETYFEEISNITSPAETDVPVGFVKEDAVEDGGINCSSALSQEEAIAGNYDNMSHIEGDSHETVEEDDSISEATDMDWEEGQCSTSEIETEADCWNKPDNDEFCSKIQNTSGNKELDWRKAPEIVIPDDTVSNCTEEILEDEVLQELFAEETASTDMQCSVSDPKTVGMPHNQELLEYTQESEHMTYGKLSSTEAFEVLTNMEDKDKEAETDLIGTVSTSDSTGEPIMESIATSGNIQQDGIHETGSGIFETNSQLGEADSGSSRDISAEVLNGHHEDEYLQTDDAETWDMVEPNKGDKIGELIKDAENTQDFAISVSSLEQELQDGEAEDATEDQERAAGDKLPFGVNVCNSSQSFSGTDQDDVDPSANQNHMKTEVQLDGIAEGDNASQDLVVNSGPRETHDHQLDREEERKNAVEKQNLLEEDHDEATKIKTLLSMDSKAQRDSRLQKLNSAGDNTGDFEKTDVEVCTKSVTAETYLSAQNGTSGGAKCKFLPARSICDQKLPDTCNNRKWTIRGKKPIKDFEKQREFNPREPNFLPFVPDPEAEKVDLRHQMMDDRKNAEDWMLDYALQQAVNKLAPARKRKVALLVEAFETVLPIPKYETPIRHASEAFSQTRPIQACR